MEEADEEADRIAYSEEGGDSACWSAKTQR